MNNKVKLIIGIAALVVLLAGAYGAYTFLTGRYSPDEGAQVPLAVSPASNASSADQKKTAPDFTVYDQNGNPVLLSSLRGKPVVLNFWASWCPPCRGEMPGFDTVYRELKDSVQFMMVDLTDGTRETQETGAEYIKSQGYAFPIYFDLEGEAAEIYGITSIPTTVIIDKDGKIVSTSRGAVAEGILREKIAALQ